MGPGSRVLAVSLALLLAASRSQAQAERVKVSLADTIRTADPGSHVSYMFMIDLDGKGGRAELAVPPGWRTLAGGGELPYGSRRISYMVAAAVPAGAQPGKYRLELAVTVGGEVYRSAAWIVVSSLHSLNLKRIESPDIVVAGSSIHARFLLTNRGNADASVRVAVRTRQVPSVDSMVVRLGPGQSREIPVTLQTDSRAGSLIESVTTVVAEEEGVKGSTVRESMRVSIAPRAAHVPAPVHAIGARVRLIGASTPGAGTGMEAAGSGLLREGSAANVEFIARRMARGHSSFGDRDEYRVSLESPVFSVRVGHQLHRLSALSENGRWAAGAHAEVKSKGVTVGGFVNRDPAPRSTREEHAVFLRRDVGNDVNFGANFLNRRGPGGGAMLTAQTSIRSLPFGSVEAEVGRALNSASAQAWSVSARGSFTGFRYLVFRQKSDSAYPGSTGGTESFDALIDARIFPGLRVRGSASDQTLARTFSPAGSIAPRHSNRVGGLAVGSRLTLEYVQNERNYRGVASTLRHEEKLAHATFRGKLAGVTFNASAGRGRSWDRFRLRKSLERYSAGASIRPTASASIAVSVDAARGATLFNPEQRSHLGGGVSASLASRSGSRFAVSAYVSERRLLRSTRDATFEASWDQQLPAGHQFSIRARLHDYTGVRSFDDNIVRVEYSMPFGLPIGHSRSRGRITGRVHDSETRTPIPGAIVQLGTHVTVTDRAGRFAFATDTNTPTFLAVGGSAATAGLMPAAEIPLAVTPRIGSTSNFDIALTKAGRLEGRVRLFVTPPGTVPGDTVAPVEDSLGLRGARLELTKDGEVRLATSNGRGEFVFPDLRPGRWSLVVSARDLPRYSYVEGDSVAVVIIGGGKVTTEIIVRPRKRKITIVQGG